MSARDGDPSLSYTCCCTMRLQEISFCLTTGQSSDNECPGARAVLLLERSRGRGSRFRQACLQPEGQLLLERRRSRRVTNDFTHLTTISVDTFKRTFYVRSRVHTLCLSPVFPSFSDMMGTAFSLSLCHFWLQIQAAELPPTKGVICSWTTLPSTPNPLHSVLECLHL